MTRRAEFLERQASVVSDESILVGGRPVRLLTAGRPDASVVLLVTGPGRGLQDDTALLLPMLARRRRVAALDLERLDDHVGAVSAVLDHLGAREAVIVGHSLGSAVAIAAAGADARVQALALVAGWLRPTERLVTLARLWRTLPAEARADLARLVAVRSPAALGPGHPSPLAVDSDLLVEAARADSSAAAGRLRIPVLVVGCTADSVVGVEGAEALLGAIDDARYAVVDSGHAVLAERPAELLAVLEHFLADPRRDPAGSVLPRMRV
ncbi:alpha/beta hydrolase [Rathayibacter oskolensis]|uniref:alpha/beta fold hydrolase n=1 Tax=Rathayibacter oskolensis TaxID=1891671 RepID=UPI00265DFD4C|nr:alpha/beta hydrolase [Rathayibacter oskolensis]WKK71913.1 alpha/beta hydrolase [Rathayibacter oskolensis]